ncbi:MAG: glycogen debranching enzyme N-terminal domain-containing protein [Planctomycetes bacterium]|nr:glycogen debranching enzyme N-terminal domain-containing protein [Planctomycetota bacterium]
MAIVESSIERDLRTEWLLTDGVGGFASSTVVHCPTRRYHGLLIALPKGRAKRYLFLARFDEVARCDGQELRAATAKYSDGSYSPGGHAAIESFETVPHPTTRYRSGSLTLTREILMSRGGPTVLSRYTATGGDVDLELRPLFAFREADALAMANDVAATEVEEVDGGFSFTMYEGLPTCHVSVGGGQSEYVAAPTWYR